MTRLSSAGGNAGTGDVTGPGSAVDEDIAVFDGTTGKLIKDGGYTIAEVIAAATSGGGVGVTAICLPSSDQSRNNNTLVDDDDLTFAVEANATYIFDALILFTTGTSNTVDFNINFTIPSGATLSWATQNVLSTATTAGSLNWQGQDRTTNLAGGGVLSTAVQAVTPLLIQGTLRTAGNAGALTFQFCQDVSTSGTPIVRKADSWMRYTRVS